MGNLQGPYWTWLWNFSVHSASFNPFQLHNLSWEIPFFIRSLWFNIIVNGIIKTYALQNNTQNESLILTPITALTSWFLFHSRLVRNSGLLYPNQLFWSLLSPFNQARLSQIYTFAPFIFTSISSWLFKNLSGKCTYWNIYMWNF